MKSDEPALVELFNGKTISENKHKGKTFKVELRLTLQTSRRLWVTELPALSAITALVV